jgi:hypothetical protein
MSRSLFIEISQAFINRDFDKVRRLCLNTDLILDGMVMTPNELLQDIFKPERYLRSIYVYSFTNTELISDLIITVNYYYKYGSILQILKQLVKIANESNDDEARRKINSLCKDSITHIDDLRKS